MTYKDYKRWAREYKVQADVLGEKIEKRRAKRFFDSAEEREDNENAVQMLYEMRRDCLCTYKLLMTKADQIKEAEENEKYRSDK